MSARALTEDANSARWAGLVTRNTPLRLRALSGTLLALALALAAPTQATAHSRAGRTHAHAARTHVFKGTLELWHTDPTGTGPDTFTYLLRTKSGRRFTLHFHRHVRLPRMDTKVTLRGVRHGLRIAVKRIMSVSAHSAAVTTGARRLAVILVNFQDDKAEPWTPEQVRQIIWTGPNSVRSFYSESSFGQMELGSKANPNGDVYGYYTIPYNGGDGTGAGCPGFTWQEAAAKAATEAGVNLADYTNVMYVWPPAECGFAGAGFVGGSASFINGSLQVAVAAHELGHNFGLVHANSLICQNAEGLYVPYEEQGCRFEEYGDPYDVMGEAAESGDAYEFNAYFKGVLGWWPGSAVQTVTNTGTYTLQPDETDSEGVHVLRIPKSTEPNGEQRYYYLEFRQPSPFDNWSSEAQFDHPMWVEKGVTIQIAGEFSNATDVKLLNMNPNVVPSFYSIWPWFAPLTEGESYTDPHSGTTIHTDSTSPLGAVVTVTVPGSTSSTPPSVSITSPTNGASASGSVAVTASASNASAVTFSVDGNPTATVTKAPYDTSWNTTAVVNGTHTITATAKNAAGQSASSAVAVNVSNSTATSSTSTGSTGATGTSSTASPTVPSSLGVSALSSSQTALSWTPSTDAAGVAGYEVLRNGTLLATVSATHFVDSGLTPSTAYSYQVRARDTLGNVSALTKPVKATTTQTKTTGILAGWVLKKATGLPLNGVKVTATLGGHSWSANTNSSGFYQVSNLAAGTYSVTVAASGSASQTATAAVLANLATIEAFSL